MSQIHNALEGCRWRVCWRFGATQDPSEYWSFQTQQIFRPSGPIIPDCFSAAQWHVRQLETHNCKSNVWLNTLWCSKKASGKQTTPWKNREVPCKVRLFWAVQGCVLYQTQKNRPVVSGYWKFPTVAFDCRPNSLVSWNPWSGKDNTICNYSQLSPGAISEERPCDHLCLLWLQRPT